MGPIREMNPSMLRTINVEDLRQLNVNVRLFITVYTLSYISLGFFGCDKNY